MRFSVRSLQSLCGVLSIIPFTFCSIAHASFSLTFQGMAQPINTGESIAPSSPAGIAVDPAGNVYMADTGNNRIVEVNALGSASVLTISGLAPRSALPVRLLSMEQATCISPIPATAGL